jgi:hypothetical protein
MRGSLPSDSWNPNEDLLQRNKLLATRAAGTSRKGYKPNLPFTVTADGEHMLGEIRPARNS